MSVQNTESLPHRVVTAADESEPEYAIGAIDCAGWDSIQVEVNHQIGGGDLENEIQRFTLTNAKGTIRLFSEFGDIYFPAGANNAAIQAAFESVMNMDVVVTGSARTGSNQAGWSGTFDVEFTGLPNTPIRTFQPRADGIVVTEQQAGSDGYSYGDGSVTIIPLWFDEDSQTWFKVSDQSEEFTETGRNYVQLPIQASKAFIYVPELVGANSRVQISYRLSKDRAF